jgi:hypothetical protein
MALVIGTIQTNPRAIFLFVAAALIGVLVLAGMMPDKVAIPIVFVAIPVVINLVLYGMWYVDEHARYARARDDFKPDWKLIRGMAGKLGKCTKEDDWKLFRATAVKQGKCTEEEGDEYLGGSKYQPHPAILYRMLAVLKDRYGGNEELHLELMRLSSSHKHRMLAHSMANVLAEGWTELKYPPGVLSRTLTILMEEFEVQASKGVIPPLHERGSALLLRPKE